MSPRRILVESMEVDGLFVVIDADKEFLDDDIELVSNSKCKSFCTDVSLFSSQVFSR